MKMESLTKMKINSNCDNALYISIFDFWYILICLCFLSIIYSKEKFVTTYTYHCVAYNN